MAGGHSRAFYPNLAASDANGWLLGFHSEVCVYIHGEYF
jgi:hypothetical protein